MFRHLECQNPSIISESIGIPNGSKKNGKKSEEEEHGGTEESYSYRRGYVTLTYHNHLSEYHTYQRVIRNVSILSIKDLFQNI